MNYVDYINSSTWRNSPARLAELKASGFRCRACNASASDVELQVHHRTYVRFGAEEVGDLTTLCAMCHRVVTDHLRREKYYGRTPAHADVQAAIANPTPLRDPTISEDFQWMRK